MQAAVSKPGVHARQLLLHSLPEGVNNACWGTGQGEKQAQGELWQLRHTVTSLHLDSKSVSPPLCHVCSSLAISALAITNSAADKPVLQCTGTQGYVHHVCCTAGRVSWTHDSAPTTLYSFLGVALHNVCLNLLLRPAQA